MPSPWRTDVLLGYTNGHRLRRSEPAVSPVSWWLVPPDEFYDTARAQVDRLVREGKSVVVTAKDSEGRPLRIF